MPAGLICCGLRERRCPTRRSSRGSPSSRSAWSFGWPLLHRDRPPELTSAHSAVIVGLLPGRDRRHGGPPRRRAPTSPASGSRASPGSWRCSPSRPRRAPGCSAPATSWSWSAVALGAIGYAEGGALARELAAGRVICWAVVLSLPLTLPIGAVAAAGRRPHAGADAWLGFAYVATVSAVARLLPLVRGLARGGVAKIGQVQLIQPLLTLGWSASFSTSTSASPRWSHRIAVLASVVATQRTRVTRSSSRPPLVTSAPVSEAPALEHLPAGRSGTSTPSATTGCCWSPRTGSRPTTSCTPRRSPTRARC